MPISFVLVIAALIGLQILLSWDGRKWPGLVLPLLTLGLSFVWVVVRVAEFDGVDINAVIYLFLEWIVCNIPTSFFMVIYSVVKRSV